jgi:hypothetical protein
LLTKLFHVHNNLPIFFSFLFSKRRNWAFHQFFLL